MTRASLLVLVLVLVLDSSASAQDAAGPPVTTRTIEYKYGDVVLEGFLAHPATKDAKKRPAVLVVHEWRGHGDYVRERAKQLAQMGYVAFALDMYGKGVFAKDHDEAAKLSGMYFGDRQRMRDRARAGLDVLRSQEGVDTTRIAAIGYCFGGATVLELARAGEDLRGVVSFHGALDTTLPAKEGEVKARILVCHGSEDKFIAPEKVAGFHDEMRKAKTDWQFISYGGAVHSFTVPTAGNDPSKGMAYDERADKRSWQAMRSFFDEVFGR